MECVETPKMRMTLPRCSDAELHAMLAHAVLKMDDPYFSVPAFWFHGFVESELNRRVDAALEPGMACLPENWNNDEVSSALLFFFILSRTGLSEGVAGVVDEIFLHVIGAARAHLECSVPRT